MVDDYDPGSEIELSLADMLAEGHAALLDALEAAGGLWSDDEVARQFGVTPATVDRWLVEGKVLAVQRLDGSNAFPAAQFERLDGDLSAPGSFASIATILAAAGDMNRGELAGLLATPQDELAVTEERGDGTARARTGYEAIQDGDADMVLELVRDLVIPVDEGAPPMPENWPP